MLISALRIVKHKLHQCIILLGICQNERYSFNDSIFYYLSRICIVLLPQPVQQLPVIFKEISKVVSSILTNPNLISDSNGPA
jgi:hypothetical protein